MAAPLLLAFEYRSLDIHHAIVCPMISSQHGDWPDGFTPNILTHGDGKSFPVQAWPLAWPSTYERSDARGVVMDWIAGTQAIALTGHNPEPRILCPLILGNSAYKLKMRRVVVQLRYLFASDDPGYHLQLRRDAILASLGETTTWPMQADTIEFRQGDVLGVYLNETWGAIQLDERIDKKHWNANLIFDESALIKSGEPLTRRVSGDFISLSRDGVERHTFSTEFATISRVL